MRSRAGLSPTTERSPMSTTTERGVVLLFSLAAYGAAAAGPSETYGLGTTPSEAELAQFVSPLPDGRGLPPGSGSAADGKIVYEQQCLACHGANLQGGIGDRLVGGRGTLVNA